MTVITVDGVVRTWVTGNKPFSVYVTDIDLFYTGFYYRLDRNISLSFRTKEERDLVDKILSGEKLPKEQTYYRLTPQDIEGPLKSGRLYTHHLKTTYRAYIKNLKNLQKRGFKTFWWYDKTYKQAILK